MDCTSSSIHMLNNGTAISTSRNWIASIVKVCPLNYHSCWPRLVNITAPKLLKAYGDFLTNAAICLKLDPQANAYISSDLRWFSKFLQGYHIYIYVLVDLIILQIRCYLNDNINNLARLLGLIFDYRIIFMARCIHEHTAQTRLKLTQVLWKMQFPVQFCVRCLVDMMSVFITTSSNKEHSNIFI